MSFYTNLHVRVWSIARSMAHSSSLKIWRVLLGSGALYKNCVSARALLIVSCQLTQSPHGRDRRRAGWLYIFHDGCWKTLKHSYYARGLPDIFSLVHNGGSVEARRRQLFAWEAPPAAHFRGQKGQHSLSKSSAPLLWRCLSARLPGYQSQWGRKMQSSVHFSNSCNFKYRHNIFSKK